MSCSARTPRAKTAATAGFASATVAEALERVLVLVNDNEVREVLTSELDQIHTRWADGLKIVAYDGIGNDLITAVPDVVVDANTTRTTTFVVPIYFAEPSRSTFTDRELFAWPTAWASGRTAKLQVKLKLAATAGFSAPEISAREAIDWVLGPVVNGKDIMPATAWKRMEEGYTGVAMAIRKWPFTGILQQFSVFSPTGASDDVNAMKITSGKTVVFDGSKHDLERLLDRNQWNNAAGAKSAHRIDYAFDFSDNPSDGQPLDDVTLFETKLTLAAAAGGNKTQVVLVQVYQDLLSK